MYSKFKSPNSTKHTKVAHYLQVKLTGVLELNDTLSPNNVVVGEVVLVGTVVPVIF